MIVYDQANANFFATSALAFGLMTLLASPASAGTTAWQSPVDAARASVTQLSPSPSRDTAELPLARIQITSSAPATTERSDADAAPTSATTRPIRIAEERIVTWTTHRTVRLPLKLQHRNDPRLAAGKTRVVDAGRVGLRVITYRFVRRSEGTIRTILASRIVRMPRARVIAHGIAAYASLARVAEQGFESAMHFAGAAIHMVATAYTAGCSGCSGITASGVRAGFGIIAVDPRVIPLGTKLFIPGYGRAVAGDTGGAILGNRVDLGMNTLHDALRYGRRPVNVYVLR